MATPPLLIGKKCRQDMKFNLHQRHLFPSVVYVNERKRVIIVYISVTLSVL